MTKAMADQKLLKEVQIKTGIVKRYVKEYYYYEKEAHKQQEKIGMMKQDPNMDEYMVKKANEVLQETRNMLPITSSNVKKALNELKQVVEGNQEALKETSQMAAAEQEIANAIAVVDA